MEPDRSRVGHHHDQAAPELLDEAKSGGEPLKTFELADGIVTATYCKDSGKLMTEACYLDPRGNRAETGYFTTSTVPTEYCDCHVLVDYDTSTGAVASPRCPSEYVTKVGLIKVDREFPMQVKVTDAQYTYRDVPDGTGYAADRRRAVVYRAV